MNLKIREDRKMSKQGGDERRAEGGWVVGYCKLPQGPMFSKDN